MGRPRKYANDAEKMRAYRERNAVLTIRLQPDTVETINRLAEQFEESQSEVISQLCKFALANRNWSEMGFPFKRLPRANPIEE
jgi:hypothetical protein